MDPNILRIVRLSNFSTLCVPDKLRLYQKRVVCTELDIYVFIKLSFQHRYDAKDPKYRILNNHFNQPGHDRCLTMKVQIIEKIYHHTNSTMLSTPYRTDRELFWIKELSTAMHYGCNDNIKGVGNLSSPGCNEINVMSLFNTIPRTKRSHGHKRIQHPNLKSPLNQERYKILLMIYFLIYRNLLEFIIFIQSYFHYL